LLGCGVIFFVALNSSLFGLLDHFIWASFFRIWAGEHIAQLGLLCVWLGLEESFFLRQLLCFSCSHFLLLALGVFKKTEKPIKLRKLEKK